LGDSDNKVETEHLVNGKPESLIYVRARVRNEGRHIAKSCRVFLTALHEVRSDGTIETVIKDSKALAWAGWQFAPIDIPSGVNLYVDLMTVSKAVAGWRFSVERLFDSQKKLLDYRGTYRFSLMVSGDNAAPARCEVNVEYVVSSYDGEFLSMCRGSRCAVTYLTQSLPNYYSKMGGDNPRDAAHTLAGKFMTHVFCSNACPETNEFASRMIGKVVTRRGNYSNGTSENINVGMNAGTSENSGSSSNSGSSYGQSYSFNSGSGSTSGSGSNWGANRGRGTSSNESRGYSESMEYAIEPGDFARCLQTGGPQNGNIVTGVWFQGGRVFKASGSNWLLERFAQ
jgi:hypothetical protein